MFAAMSVKVSTLGHTFDKDACLRNLLSIAKEASLRGIDFEIDMEGRATVDFTLDAARAIVEARYPVTVALQAYLDRTAKDIESMVKNGMRVRLLKGAYAGDVQDFEDIQGRFKNLMRALADSGQDFCAGTYDPELIVWATVKMQEHPERVEFGSLKGHADQTKLDFVKNKWRVSEYVPFGPNRAAYEERRRTHLRNIERLGRTTAP
jgi:proline dehydrogenase